VNLTIVKTLPKGEQSLIMDTRPKRLAGLSEDQLLELHGRVRRGRNKYKKNFRRGAAKQVKAKGSRAVATKERRADAQRREVFEDALARVSDRLAKAARRSADDLRTKRLARAKKEKAAEAEAKARAAAKAKAKKAKKAAPKAAAKGKRTSKKTPVRKKAVAGQRATKARKNARKGR
jgi:hypothetical protein